MSETMEDIFSFGAWVRRRRKALDLTQAALAQQVGCAEVTIRKLEADAFRPSQEIAQRLAQCLGIPADSQVEFVRVARAEYSVDRLSEPLMALGVTPHSASARIAPNPLYDLFISYADSDQAWVHGFLLDALEQARIRYHCENHFAPGTLRLLELKQAIAQSRYTVLVISTAYLTDDFAEVSDLLVQHYGQEPSAWRVVPLLRDHAVTLPPPLHMLTALNAADPTRWSEAVERLCSLLQRSAPQALPKIKCPYPGMVAFGEADQDRFYGRDREVDALLAQLRLHPFVTVIGPSGSGKSSLVFAGLVPALKRSGLFGSGEWIVESLRPGESPLTALGAVLQADPAAPVQSVAALLAHQPTASRLLVVVDQFEEIFTVARQDVEAFQTALLHLAQAPQCYVVLTVRADFYADLMASCLWSMVQAHRLEVVPLDESGLRQAIVRPAEALGVFVEPALRERLITDAAGEPGVLPLVQETLVLLWERLERRFLPLSAYHALVHTGSNHTHGSDRTGLQVAIARRADDALRSLSPDQHRIGRRVFLRLIQFGEGRADTRRQQAVDHLRALSDDPDQFDTTLHHLISRRLLTASGHEDGPTQKVDIAHEALISGWPTLHQWLVERRDAEQTRRRLEAKADEWVRLGRRNGGLLDDVELLESERWLQSPDAADLGYDAALLEFIEASRKGQTEWLVHQRQVARFRRLALSVIVLLIITALSIGLWSMQRSLNFERQQARISTASQLAAQSQAELDHDPQRSLLLSAEALSTTVRVNEPPVLVAQEAVRKALASTSGYGLSGHAGPVETVAISSDNHWLVTGSWDGTARVWDLTAEDPAAQPLVLRGHEGPIWAVTISSDNHSLVTAGSDGTARVWDLTAGAAAEPRVLRGHEGVMLAVAISNDNRWLMIVSADGMTQVWDLTAGAAAEPRVLRGHEGAIRAVAISSDTRRFVTAGEDGTARVWDFQIGNTSAGSMLSRTHIWQPESLVVSNDNRWLVIAGDKTAEVWDLRVDPAQEPQVLRWHEGPIWAAAISNDNRWLVTAGSDGTAQVWDLKADPAGEPRWVLQGHEGPICAVVISSDSRWLVTGSSDGTARVWDLRDPAEEPQVVGGHEGTIRAVTISSDNRWLLTAGDDGATRVWDLRDPAEEPQVVGGHEGTIRSVVISSDNRWLVTGSIDGIARVWDLKPDPAGEPLVLGEHEGAIRVAAISNDSRWLVTGSEDGMARVWDLRDSAREPLWVLRGHQGTIRAVTISSDNRWLVTAGVDGTARVWDLTAVDPATQPLVLRGYEGLISAAAISNDNRWLVTISGATARLWPLKLDDLIARACRTAGRNLTRAEWTRYMPKEQPYRATCPNFPLEPDKQDETPTAAPV